MAAKNTISVSQMDEIIKGYQNEITVDFHGQELTIRRTLTFEEMAAVARRVADACFDPDTGACVPEKRRFAEFLLLTALCTNVRLPQNLEHQYQYFTKTDLYDVITENIDRDQWNDMQCAILDRIEYRNDANEKLFDAKLDAAMQTVTAFAEKIGKIFEDVSPEDVIGLVQAVSEGGVDEERLVQAVVKATAPDGEDGGIEDGPGGEAKVIPFPAPGGDQDDDGE